MIAITAIILTYNEEKNIKECLDSVYGFCNEIFIVDSGSTDCTLEILNKYPDVKVVSHEFINYSNQRNWAFKNLNISNEWILNMDADHRLTQEFKIEVRQLFSKSIEREINGFLVSRKTMFMGKWIKYGGHYPTYHAILFRKGSAVCEEKLYDQHFLVHGKTKKMKGDVIDLITDSLSTFTIRHDKWSSLESIDQLNRKNNQEEKIKANLFGNAIERRRYLKNIYEEFPLFVRPFVYFFIRYFLRLGFLDGKRGLIFHFLQCFWFRFLIDSKIFELRHLTSMKDVHAEKDKR